MIPQRIQLSRTKGWRMPENTVKTDRSTKWGNPFVVGKKITFGPLKGSVVADVRHSFFIYEWKWVQILPAEFMVGGDSEQSLWRCRLTGMPEEWQIENGSFWQWRGKL